MSADLLDAIYAELYRLGTVDTGGFTHRLCPSQEVIGIEDTGDGPLRVVSRDADADTLQQEPADVVILATGYRYELPEFLEPLRERIEYGENGYRTRADYSIAFDGPDDCRIHVQNAATHTHGVADANLSLMAWRNAVIANAVTGRELYATDSEGSMIARRPAARVAPTGTLTRTAPVIVRPLADNAPQSGKDTA